MVDFLDSIIVKRSLCDSTPCTKCWIGSFPYLCKLQGVTLPHFSNLTTIKHEKHIQHTIICKYIHT